MGARLKSRASDILEANKADVDQAKNDKMSEAKLDRLKLDDKRIDELAKTLEAVGNPARPGREGLRRAQGALGRHLQAGPGPHRRHPDDLRVAART
jgi:gamma-glutamyl phosphate reductase